MQSSYNVSTTKGQATTEWDFYRQLPDLAIIELPRTALLEKQQMEHRMCGGYGFVLEDLIDDCLANLTTKEVADDALEEWFDDTSFALSEAYGDVYPHIDYLNIIGKIFYSLKDSMNLLYTPSGHHYYEFKEWLDTRGKTTMVLAKRRYVD